MPLLHQGKSLFVVVLVGSLLSGCATTDGTTDDQQATAAEGAAFGSVLATVLGAATGQRRASRALVGLAAGGTSGYSVGAAIAERKAQYATEEDFLVAEIRRNQEFAQEAAAQNRQIAGEIARLDRESQRLTQGYRAGQVSRDALTQQQAILEKQLTKAKQVNTLTERQLAETNQVYTETRQTRGPQDQYFRQLELNLVGLKETRQQSSQNVNSLQRIYDTMSI
jgi:hypothetical protein